MEPTYRIGNKLKSVRLKSYIVDFYAEKMGITIEEAKLKSLEYMLLGCEKIGNKNVTADYVIKCLLLDI
jgi:hypothetical protein